ncbi:MAG TPA: tannase/feruloyl esterase family alpha/beta hydrolase, partial [Blastocatellia bacterium]|nr:tannase/feruloyl esterase family alpha/beta hydrolase [Blastocatellia bacterium]
MNTLRFAAFALIVFIAQSISAQPNPLTPPAGESALTPKCACADLRSLTNYDFSIESATLIPATTDAPARCRVKGLIQPEIQFEVNLPTTWNRRFYMFGNGGYAGENLDAPNRIGQRVAAIRRGFVVADTNTGHDAATEPLGTFAVNRQKLLDYAFRSLHTTADAGKRIAETYFGAKPTRSYYEGCSTGGRQGLILAQRFPDDFDGLVIGAPVLNFSGTMIGYTQTLQALAKAPIPYSKLQLLAEKIYAQCDEKDGLKDGVIDDPRKCQFCPSCDLPQCADG